MIALRLLVSAVCAAAVPAQQHAQPNVVLILADDMGYGDARCYNAASRIPTPHIDALARDGLRFTDAHAPGALCVPSRYGLLTGRYPIRRGAMRPGREPVIDASRTTLASMLAARGYATAMVGKWHLGFEQTDDWSRPLAGGPLDRGFASFFGIPASLDIPPYYYIRDRHAVAPPTEHIAANHSPGWTKIQGAFWRAGGIAPGFAHRDVLPRFTREAVQEIDALAGVPFFLYLALAGPHTPWLPREDSRGRSEADLYGDFVTEIDDTVGEVMRALQRNGIDDSTLVLFTSDNGPVWYPSDAERYEHSAVGPLRGMKADAWEGGHRVPFVARWPGVVPAGKTTDATICFTDVMATLADVTGAHSAGEDSVSFAPVLRGSTEPTREVTLLKTNGSVVRSGQWKLIEHLGSGGFSSPRRRKARAGEPEGQLYDLRADLAETRNLWEERPDVVAKLRADKAKILRPTRPNFVIILADDMGYGDSEVYDGWLKTPHLARMAREGLTLTDFHSSGVVCSPTRAGLMTGLYQQRTGVAQVVNADPENAAHRLGLSTEYDTFAELLRDAGYRTGMFGKWHLGYTTEFNPVHHGFEVFRGFVSGNIDYQSHYDRMGTADWWRGTEKVSEKGYLTELLTQHAVDFIDRHAAEPFCLYLPHGAVHAPIQGPTSNAVRGPNAGPVDGRPRNQIVREMMTSLDDHIGAVLDRLRHHGIEHKTLVVFLSDNGGAAHMRNDPLRGRKGTVWEGGHRVPALAWWPGTIAAGKRSDSLGISLDLMPTMLELAGVPCPKVDGVSLAGVFAGGALSHRQLFWNGVAMRDGAWKLVLHKGKTLLFDLARDLGERRDVAAEQPERVESMQRALAAWRRDVGM